MKKTALSVLLIAFLFGCSKTEETPTSSKGTVACGTYKSGQTLYRGPEGGCYYINSNGNKTYVERSDCKCN